MATSQVCLYAVGDDVNQQYYPHQATTTVGCLMPETHSHPSCKLCFGLGGIRFQGKQPLHRGA